MLIVNVLGSFLLGSIFVLADETGLLGARVRLFLAVGILGGFTTFSTFGWDADLLFADGRGLGWRAAVRILGLVWLGAWSGVTAGPVYGAADCTLVGALADTCSAKALTNAACAVDWDPRRDMEAIETEDRVP